MSNAKEELKKAIKKFISEYTDEPDSESIQDTPNRFVKYLEECLEGYSTNPRDEIRLFDSENSDSLITVSSINFSSMCEHHLAPFFGVLDISYIPSDKILGLSKFARVVDSCSKRLQVQERLTKQITDLLEENMKPKVLMVRLTAKHTCMSVRGVKRDTAVTTTTSLRGDIDEYSGYVGAFLADNKLEGHNVVH